MLLQKTNIQKKLILAKKKDNSSELILKEVYEILKELDSAQERIAQNLAAKSLNVTNLFNFDLLEASDIYSIGHIKKIAIDYRLRFLDSHYYKGEIPPGALSKIRKLEMEHGIELKGFKILAPSKLFKLKDPDDPILFVPINNGYYYLIHKWGNDLHPFRKALMWPYKNMGNLLVFILLLSYLLTLIVPHALFSKTSSTAQFLIIYFFMIKSVVSMVVYYAFAKGQNFSPAVWNSKYLKT
ncbi:hypothetical protein [Arenibacter certesii]|uniref:Uncharacterized protein n=1 Tax=Arenibacter certesii TaxID=228955 RepID=A0A918J1A9_9FLAO|nr:hypothetical protein [Arenibacter certesii]GGW42785.1 hypothetical protein GCM10007383_29290 [Arenibacter certesii]